MRIVLLRHAIAEDSAPSGKADRLRELTDEGRRKMRKGAEALARLVPDLALVVTSPYLRTRETAEILAKACARKPAVSELPELAPAGSGNTAAIVKFLLSQKALSAVALVGHEPDLSLLAGYLLTGKASSFVEMRKGGACLLDFPGRIAPGGARLVWHLPPAPLRHLRGFE
jgi:phosphohistidine phosphatase